MNRRNFYRPRVAARRTTSKPLPKAGSESKGLIIAFIIVALLGLGGIVFLVIRNQSLKEEIPQAKRDSEKVTAQVNEPAAPGAAAAETAEAPSAELTPSEEFARKMREQNSGMTRPEFQAPALAFLSPYTKEPASIRIKEWSFIKEWRSGVIFGADFSCKNLIGSEQEFRAIFCGENDGGTVRVGRLDVPNTLTDLATKDLRTAVQETVELPNLEERVKNALK